MMKKSVDNGARIHINVMELLVREEIEKQLELYPTKMINYINKVEVATYALNRLPPLYASSFIGKEHQKRTGQQKYKSQIILAVRRALAAIERDPIRQSVPLVVDNPIQYESAKISLDKLEKLFKKQGIIANHQELSWNKLTRIIYSMISKAKSQKRGKYEKDLQSLSYVSNPLVTNLPQKTHPSGFKN
ncbi:MAG: late competence development ComFB family protein [Crocosphaera sp.]